MEELVIFIGRFFVFATYIMSIGFMFGFAMTVIILTVTQRKCKTWCASLFEDLKYISDFEKKKEKKKQMKRAADSLAFMLSCKDEVARKSGCFQVYQNVQTALKECQHDEHVFKIKYPEVMSHKLRIVLACTTAESKDASLSLVVRQQLGRQSLHLIGQMLQKELAPRFIKEHTRAEGVSQEEHTAQWFRLNSNVNPETDQTLIFAGFLAMFDILISHSLCLCSDCA